MKSRGAIYKDSALLMKETCELGRNACLFPGAGTLLRRGQLRSTISTKTEAQNEANDSSELKINFK